MERMVGDDGDGDLEALVAQMDERQRRLFYRAARMKLSSLARSGSASPRVAELFRQEP